MGDLYDFIVRVVEDRLRLRENPPLQGSAREPPSASLSAPEPTPEPASRDAPQWHVVQKQLAEIAQLLHQLLEATHAHQQRTEGLLGELLVLLRQALEAQEATAQGVTNGQGSDVAVAPETLASGRGEFLSDASEATVEQPSAEPSSQGYAVMAPPEQEEIPSPVEDERWLEEPPPQPVREALAADGVASVAAPSSILQAEDFPERLAEHLKRQFAIEVDYLKVRQTQTSSPILQNAQVLMGEGSYNGQPVTLTIFVKPTISPADVTLFCNAIVRPLRGSVEESVIGIVVGETFEPKALRVAHTFDLLVIYASDLGAAEAY